MPSTKDLRDRIRSVSNTAKVTGAMQLIAASKMNRAQIAVQKSRSYSDQITSVLSVISDEVRGLDLVEILPLLKTRTVKKVLLLLITPDRGLAGPLVSNLNKEAGEFIAKSEAPVSVVTIGRKGEKFIARTSQDLLASYSVPDRPKLEDTLSVSRFLIDQYENENFDKVVIIYSRFLNTASQVPDTKIILPVSSLEKNEVFSGEFIYEPDPVSVLKQLIPRYVETLIFQSVLEAIASEHSSRMVAMQNATDNANELIDELTLDLNKARQESITSELLDIVGGVTALESKK